MPPDTLLLDVAGPMEVFRRANLEQERVRFEYHYISPRNTQRTSIGLQISALESLPEVLPDDAWIMISGSLTASAYLETSSVERAEIVSWLVRAFRPGMTLVTICSGALLAGEAGLFHGRQCTTHAECIAALRQKAPGARVLDDRLFVEDGPVLSSAGISTGVDLAFHIVANIMSPAVAVRIARQMVVYMRRSGSDPQVSPWLAGRNHVHPAIHRAQDAIMREPAAEWSLARVADTAHLSERHLSRLFREETGFAVNDYVNMIRVTLARDIINGSKLSMEAVAERAGFASARHMRRVWSKHFSHPPGQIKAQNF
nr:helix-turn-helix domain-containing protein [Rhizobium sp. L1K21]